MLTYEVKIAHTPAKAPSSYHPPVSVVGPSTITLYEEAQNFTTTDPPLHMPQQMMIAYDESGGKKEGGEVKIGCVRPSHGDPQRRSR